MVSMFWLMLMMRYGSFVGNVRQEYERVLNDVIENCTLKENFSSNQTKEVINYIKKKYGDELEFLWEKYDNNAIWRNKKNNKWYGVLMTIPLNRLKGDSDEEVEVIDLKCDKKKINSIIDNNSTFLGYHMNKKSWISVILDGSVPFKTLTSFIDESYDLSLGLKGEKNMNDFSNKVYEYLLLIPKGKVVTYKQVAEYLGNKGLARVVGNILHKNPDGDKYPCYKVLNSKGELAESFVFGGKNVQKDRLVNEGIEVCNDRVDLEKYQWRK